jgi:hypothetical protein
MVFAYFITVLLVTLHNSFAAKLFQRLLGFVNPLEYLFVFQTILTLNLFFPKYAYP